MTDFTKQLITAEGEKWEHDEKYTDKKGIVQTRKEKLTYYKVARESLIGTVGNARLNNVRNTKRRFNLFLKIHNTPKNPDLTWFERRLLKKLVAMRFDVAPAARLINLL